MDNSKKDITLSACILTIEWMNKFQINPKTLGLDNACNETKDKQVPNLFILMLEKMTNFSSFKA